MKTSNELSDRMVRSIARQEHDDRIVRRVLSALREMGFTRVVVVTRRNALGRLWAPDIAIDRRLALVVRLPYAVRDADRAYLLRPYALHVEGVVHVRTLQDDIAHRLRYLPQHRGASWLL